MKELSQNFDSKGIETEVKNYLSDKDVEKNIFEDPNKTRKIMFIEGPPTMNGTPHAGHLRGRVIKDMWYRYKTLQGYKVVFNAGWDTQGLPVELQAEKELGVTGGKSEIVEKVGIEKLVTECKKIVKKYNEEWVKVDNLLGMSFNQEEAYWTYKDNYIEREWNILKKAHENGILEDDYTVIAYCPGCQTSLSHAEVNQGYEEVKDPSLYYKVKLADEDAFLIVWTTMPFTLVTDAMIGLKPDEDYVFVDVNKETWIVGKSRLEEFMQEARIDNFYVKKTVKGKELGNKKYTHPLIDVIPELEKISQETNYHTTVAEDFVDSSTGSGLVHLSPANGEDDIKIANKRNVRIFNPINDEVKFTKEAGKYQGLYVRDADKVIVEDLKERGLLVKIGKTKHKYPHCWRSHHPIVWLARKGWFYKLDKLGDKAVKAAESVEYFYDQPKNRFLGIVKERHPWCISRERFWGCPLPMWLCTSCGEKNWFFSREEILSQAEELSDGKDFELHRPWIDRIKIKCKNCSKTTTKREQYVLDTWHNSGAAPYASLTDKEYKDGIPAPFFTEGIDQTRGWAYTLLIENVILNNAPIPPYRSFLFQGHVLDKNGNKMSKSLGNVIEAEELLSKYPVDLVRFYFVWKSSPIEPLNFSTEEMMSRPYQVLSTLYHLHLYFKQNSEYDKFDPMKTDLQWAKKNDLLYSPDVWVLSKLQNIIKKVQEQNDSCRYHESAKSIEDFIINLLSQIYIPITRGELWVEDEEKKDRRLAIYAVLFEVLRVLDIIIHPLCPFTSEYLYLKSFSKKHLLLLENWPKHNESLINTRVEESFDIMREVVSVASAARMKAKLKRRWPLNTALICVKEGQKEKLESLPELLQNQLNVESFKIYEIKESKDDYLAFLLAIENLGLPIIPKIELDRKKIGPKAKQHMSKVIDTFSKMDEREIICEIVNNKKYVINIEGQEISIEKDDIVVDFDAKEGYSVASRDNYFVFVSVKRNKEMMAKGLVKDIARRIQTLRKEKGYNPTDILEKAAILGLDDESLAMIKEKADELAFLVRVKRIEFSDSCQDYKEEEIDSKKIKLAVE